MAASTHRLGPNFRDVIVKAAAMRLSDEAATGSTTYIEILGGTGVPSGAYGRPVNVMAYLQSNASTGDTVIWLTVDNGTTWITLDAALGSDLELPTATELTIATGAITVTQALHTIDTEADAASDDLDTISGVGAGELVIFYPANDSRTVVFKHGTDNIVCPGGRDISLDDSTDHVLCFGDGTSVYVLAVPQIVADLASTGTGYGASMLGSEDAGGYFVGSDQEAINQEMGLFAKRLTPSKVHRLFDDFNEYQTGFTEADSPWVLNSGSDGAAVDPDVAAADAGEIRLTSGGAGTGVAADGAQLAGFHPVQPDSGNLIFEARLKLADITGSAVFAGLTDTKSLEIPATIGGGDAIGGVADDFAGFLFDPAADTDEWFGVAADSTALDTGNAATGEAPVNDTWQRLTMSVSSDGATIVFAIDGATVLTLSGDAGVSPDVPLYPTIITVSAGAASKVVSADYVYLSHDR